MKRETFLSTIDMDSRVALPLVISAVFAVIFLLAALPSGMRMTLLCLGVPVLIVVVVALVNRSAETSQAERQHFFATLAKHFDTPLHEPAGEMIAAAYRGRDVTVQWRSYTENKRGFQL